ncbi:MAG: hypothetical protein F4Y03_05485 [Alphaproteobacteria bacterium]|nr:hypothetical protein [Alphaproteobacteria bacterium]
MLNGTITGAAFVITAATAPAFGGTLTTALTKFPPPVPVDVSVPAKALGHDAHIQLLVGVAVEIKDFPFDGGTIQLDPALKFFANLQDDGWEVWGEDLYASVLTRAPDPRGVVDELRTEILPFLWLEYALADDATLDQGAKALKADLRGRTAE